MALAAQAACDGGVLAGSVVQPGRSYFDTNTTDHHHFFVESNGHLEDIPGDSVALARLPEPPKGTRIERVEVIVRDRNQSSVVLSSSARQRFTDYEIDPVRGEIVMRAPVPSVDADLNPVYLRVSYEVESGGTPFWVTGFEGRARVSERLEVGGTYVDDLDPEGSNELRSAFAGTRLHDGSILEGGSFQAGAPLAIEVHVKDTSRFGGDGWAFFGFGGDEPATMIPREANCYSCHEANTAVDRTFVQFYPTLLPIARAKGTLSEAYLAQEAKDAAAAH